MDEQVTMTAAERAEFEAFRAAKAKKEAEARRKADREAYAQLVDETIDGVVPSLESLSATLADSKSKVFDAFKNALEMKSALFGTKDGQNTHTFTNSAGTVRVTIGYYTLDNYRDTAEEGIAMVREAIESLASDDVSRRLVSAVLRLLARDQRGNLKASRVLQLEKLAEESAIEKFIEGVRIIKEAYQPVRSKTFVRVDRRRVDAGQWQAVPLGMTEA